MDEDEVRGLDVVDEAGVLGVVDVRAETDVLDRHFAFDFATVERGEVLGLVLEVLRGGR